MQSFFSLSLLQLTFIELLKELHKRLERLQVTEGFASFEVFHVGNNWLALVLKLQVAIRVRIEDS